MPSASSRRRFRSDFHPHGRRGRQFGRLTIGSTSGMPWEFRFATFLVTVGLTAGTIAAAIRRQDQGARV